MENIVVLDCGSRTFRAGYAGAFPSEEEPRVRAANAVEDHSRLAADGSPHVLRPVQRGEILNLDALESLIHHSLYDVLGWEIGGEGGVVVAEPLLMSKRCRENLTQLMFEVFNVDGFFVQDQASLSLYAMGKLAGCVVDVGHGKIDVSTVMDGQVNPQSIRRLPVAGQDLTEWFGHLMSRTGGSRLAPADAEALKECCAKAAPTREEFDRIVSVMQQQQRAPSQDGGSGGGAQQPAVEPEQWELPDGQQFTTTSEGYQVGEALIDPSILLDPTLGVSHSLLSPALRTWAQGPGLPAIVAECTASTASAEVVPTAGMAKRADQVADVLVCGGGALIPGLSQRLVHELKAVCPLEPTPSACTLPEYMPAGHSLAHAAWLGGVVVGKVLSSGPHWVTKWDYDETGPPVVARKCGA